MKIVGKNKGIIQYLFKVIIPKREIFVFSINEINKLLNKKIKPHEVGEI